MTDKQIKRQMLGLCPFTNEVLPIEIKIGNHKIKNLTLLRDICDKDGKVDLFVLVHKIIDRYVDDINKIDITEQSFDYQYDSLLETTITDEVKVYHSEKKIKSV